MIAAAMLMSASSAFACVAPPEGIWETDLENVPDGLVAARAQITAINWHGPHRGLPHSEVTVEFRVLKAVAGVSSETLSVEYSSCQWVPGKVGETVPVIARWAFNGKLAAVGRNYLRLSVK
jgi:hypothetical protein